MQKYQMIWFSIFIALSAFFQYSNTLHHDYVWDDLIVITNNKKVKKGFGGIKEIFMTYNPSSEELSEQYGYRPITLSSFALDVELFGVNPYYGHLMNIIYFSVLCVVLFLCLQMLFYSYSIWLPFFATLLFVAHPIHAEVVANIKSRDEILALLFGLLALIAAVKYIQKDKISHAFLSVFCFIMAILSKEHLTVFSLVIPLTIMLFYKTSLNKILHLAIPFLTIVVIRLFAFNEINYSEPILFILIGTFLLFVFYEIMLFFETYYAENTLEKGKYWQILAMHIQLVFEKNVYIFSAFMAVLFFISLFFTKAYIANTILFAFVVFYLILNEQHKNKLLPFLGLALAMLIFCFSQKNILPFVYILLIIQTYRQQVFLKNTIFVSLSLFLAAFPTVASPTLLIIFFVPLAIFAASYYTQKNIILPIMLATFAFLTIVLQASVFSTTSFVLLSALTYALFQKQLHKALVPTLLFLFFSLIFVENINKLPTENWMKAKQTITTALNIEDFGPKEKNKQDEWGLYIEDKALGNSLFFAQTNTEYAATSVFVLGKYLKNFFVPYPLVYFYGYNQIPLTNFANWKVLLSIVLYLILLFAAFFSLFHYRNKAFFFGIMFYLFNIILYSHLIVTLPDTMSDRYLFTPSVGLCIFVVLMIGQIFNHSFKISTSENIKAKEKKTVPLIDTKKHKKNANKKTKTKSFDWASLQALQTKLFGIPILILCLMLASMTHNRSKAWENEKTLFSTDMPHLQNCARANYYYGNMKFRSYPNATATEQEKLKEEMLYHFNKSISITDKSFYAFWHLARSYMNFAMYDEAYQILQQAEKVYPNEFKTHHLMGMYFYYTQDYETAIEWFEKAQKLAVKNQDNYYYLAWSHYKNGEQEKGIEVMEKAIESQPEYEGFYNVLGSLYFDYGETQKGITALKKVIELKPDFTLAYQTLITQLRQLGLESEGDSYYRKGVENGAF